MPKRYRPELDCEPVGWGLAEEGYTDTEIVELAASFNQVAHQLLSTLEKCGSRLEEDDREAFFTELELILIQFVFECRAHPLRTPTQLLPTAREIRRDPDGLFREKQYHSPDVVALVYREFNRMFPGDVLLRWEAGEEKAAPTLETKLAAKAAITILRQRAKGQKRGRPPQKLVKRLAVKLGKLFLNAGGKLVRTHDFLSGEERGPFRDFLELIITLVTPLVMTTGHQPNSDTMVRWAQQKLLPRDRGRKKVTT
jgi:hypothetical protein